MDRTGDSRRSQRCTLRRSSGTGEPPPPTKIGRGGKFRCAVCDQPIPEDEHLKPEGVAGRIGTQLMAVAVDTPSGRLYLPPTADVEPPCVDPPDDLPEIELADDSRALWCRLYGASTLSDQFNDRQLLMLATFADAVAEVAESVRQDGGDEDYVRAVTSVLGLCVGKLSQANSMQVRWNVRGGGSSKAEPAFSRHALPMVWDFAEVNPSGSQWAAGRPNWIPCLEDLRRLPYSGDSGRAEARDAREACSLLDSPGLIATDPPYFAQIGYAGPSRLLLRLASSRAPEHSP